MVGFTRKIKNIIIYRRLKCFWNRNLNSVSVIENNNVYNYYDNIIECRRESDTQIYTRRTSSGIKEILWIQSEEYRKIVRFW